MGAAHYGQVYYRHARLVELEVAPADVQARVRARAAERAHDAGSNVRDLQAEVHVVLLQPVSECQSGKIQISEGKRRE
jgi:hypothetical protein